MNHPERISTSTHRAGRSITAAGWILIWGLAAFMAGALYAITNL